MALASFLQMSIRKIGGKQTSPEPKPGEWIKPRDFAKIVRLTPLVAIDLVVRSPKGRVLVGRRTNEPAKNLLFVPGSRISKNETRAAAFRRITREELGVELGIEKARFLGVYDHIYAANRFEKNGFGYVIKIHFEKCGSQEISHVCEGYVRKNKVVVEKDNHFSEKI